MTRRARAWVTLKGILAFALLLGAHMQVSAAGDVAPKEPHAVYAITAYAGPTYTNTFCPPKIDTIYLIAGKDSVLDLRETLVFYWPITKDFKADWSGLNKPVTGTLEVTEAHQVVRRVTAEDYTLEYTDIRSRQGKARLLLGAEAREGRAQFQKVWEEFPEQARRYQEAVQEYRNKQSEGTAVPEEEPVPPKEIDAVVSPVQSGFVLNLPVGNYHVRLRRADGQIAPESEKELVVFTRRREGVGYLMIPESKWTQPEMTDAPEDQLYVRGDAPLYLQPFREEEFNELYYSRVVDPQNRLGSADRWMWVHGEPLLQGVTLELTPRDGKVVQVQRKPYYVRQAGGSGLGYEVLEWSEETLPGRTPTFDGYRISLQGQRALDFWLSDSDGQILSGSTRQMRPVRGDTALFMVLPALIPLVFGGVLFVETRRKGPKVPKSGEPGPPRGRRSQAKP